MVKNERIRLFFFGVGGGGDAGVMGAGGGAFDLTWIGVGGVNGAAGTSGSAAGSLVEERTGGCGTPATVSLLVPGRTTLSGVSLASAYPLA